MISQKWPANCIDPRKKRNKDFAGVMFAKPFLLTGTGRTVGKEKTNDSTATKLIKKRLCKPREPQPRGGGGSPEGSPPQAAFTERQA